MSAFIPAARPVKNGPLSLPLFGAHMSAAGGAFKALSAAHKLGMEAVQLFTKNNNQWTGKPLSDEDIRLFRQTLRETGLKHPTAHDSYLINLASPDPALWQKSVDAFVDEVDRADALGIEYLVTHPGAHVGAGEEAGLAHASVANFDNTFLLARHRLVRRLGRASPASIHAACRALATAAGCPP